MQPALYARLLPVSDGEVIHLAGILHRLPEHLPRFLTLDAGDILAYIADEGAVAAGAADRLRGHIGAVGFQDDAFQRQGGNGPGGPLGPLEGAGPAKANVEPLLCQPERVIGAAGIAVDDALGPVFFQQGVDKIYKDKIKFYCPRFVCTAGGDKVSLRTNLVSKEYPIEPLEAVSTIGAGDNFNAGLIYGLLKYDVRYRDLNNLNEEVWDKVVQCGKDFAAEVCRSFSNSVSVEFAGQYASK